MTRRYCRFDLTALPVPVPELPEPSHLGDYIVSGVLCVIVGAAGLAMLLGYVLIGLLLAFGLVLGALWWWFEDVMRRDEDWTAARYRRDGRGDE